MSHRVDAPTPSTTSGAPTPARAPSSAVPRRGTEEGEVLGGFLQVREPAARDASLGEVTPHPMHVQPPAHRIQPRVDRRNSGGFLRPANCSDGETLPGPPPMPPQMGQLDFMHGQGPADIRRGEQMGQMLQRLAANAPMQTSGDGSRKTALTGTSGVHLPPQEQSPGEARHQAGPPAGPKKGNSRREGRGRSPGHEDRGREDAGRRSRPEEGPRGQLPRTGSDRGGRPPRRGSRTPPPRG